MILRIAPSITSSKIPILRPARFVFRPKEKEPGGVILPSPGMEGNTGSIPQVSGHNQVPLQQTSVHQSSVPAIDPKTLIGFVPSYDGDPFTIYNYLNNARQWLHIVGGNTPLNVMLLLSKLQGRAATIVSMVDHGFNFDNIEAVLKTECGDNREFNTLLVELANVKKKGSYKDFIFELKQKLFFIKSKLTDKHGLSNKTLVEEVMEPYINTAQNTLRYSLPYHDQVFVSNCNFNDTVQKILQLEAEGRFDNIKQKFSNILPAPRIINQTFPQNQGRPPYQHEHRYTYPVTPRSLQQRFNNMQHVPRPQVPYHSRNPWTPNNNNVFQRPQHQFFQQNKQGQQPQQNLNRNPQQRPNINGEDVTMRTAPPLKPGQVNLGKGYVAEELYYHPETEEEQSQYEQNPDEYDSTENAGYESFEQDYPNPNFQDNGPPNENP